MTEESDEEEIDFEAMEPAQRRRLIRRLRETPFKRTPAGSPYDPGSELEVAWRAAVEKIDTRSAAENARRITLVPIINILLENTVEHSFEISKMQAISLLSGGKFEIDGKIYHASSQGELFTSHK